MKKSIVYLLILITCLALSMGVACADENLDTPLTVDESQMEVENTQHLSSSEGNVLKESESEEYFKASNDPLDSNLKAPQNNQVLTASEEGNFTELQELINSNYGGTLVLNKSYTYNQGFSSEGIYITGSITIDGNNNVLNGNNLGRIFNIAGNNVILKNIKFINGLTSYEGGAINLNGNYGNLINCSFYNNSAQKGGAVYLVKGNNFIVEGSTFINNSAVYGGAITFCGDYSRLENSFFADNFAVYQGGAVFWQGKYGDLNNCNFTGNVQKRSEYNSIKSCGGAVYWSGSNGILSYCNFINNTADADGGAVYWIGVDGILKYSNFDNNSALSSAGGAVSWDSSKGKNGFLSNCYFVNNFAGISGGAVYWGSLGGVGGKLTDCIFINNTVGGSGGAIVWCSNKGNISNCLFYNNKGSYRYGGAIEVCGDQCTITDCDFINNYNDQGGAIYMGYIYGDQGVIKNCRFINNTAKSDGGAIYLMEEYETVINCTFENNSASWSGGAIRWRGKYGTISDSTFDNNTAKNGGAVYRDDEGGYLLNCNFTNNHATSSYISNVGFGGAVFWWSGSNGVIDNCIFENNSAKFGGAIRWGHKNGKINNCYFFNNSADGPIFSSGNDYHGGAIAFEYYSANTKLTNCIFADNHAKFNGGAVYFHDLYSTNGWIFVDNCDFIDNFANKGGAISVHMNLNLSNSEFLFNKATQGSAIYSQANNNNILNSKFLDNQASSNRMNVVSTIDAKDVFIVSTFYGNDNILNAIYSEKKSFSVNNITYWGVDGVMKTSDEWIAPNLSMCEAGQNVTVEVYGENDNLILNFTGTTDEEGILSLDLKFLPKGNYSVKSYLNENTYYTYVLGTGQFSVVEALADLSVVKALNKDIHDVGDIVHLTVTVTNHGPDHAENVIVFLNIPDELEFHTSSHPKPLSSGLLKAENSPSYDHDSGFWNVGDLANGDSAQLYLTLKASTHGDYDLHSEVSSSTFDHNEDNNAHKVSLSVLKANEDNNQTDDEDNNETGDNNQTDDGGNNETGDNNSTGSSENTNGTDDNIDNVTDKGNGKDDLDEGNNTKSFDSNGIGHESKLTSHATGNPLLLLLMVIAILGVGVRRRH